MSRQFSAQRLRHARTAAGFTPETLAIHIGRSVFTVHGYERGKASPSALVLGRIADVLGCAVDDLFEQAVNNYAA
ncbi:MAG TPA: helix-turn-helix transcriptional regulator [Amycolatopsis sp.]|nr:helix-turn-helix transcriptional regulator [Amycolatopsis sp.]